VITITRRLIVAMALLTLSACNQAETQTRGVQPVYDQHTAFVLVAQDVPAKHSDYYLYDFSAGLTVTENAEEILQGLRDNPLQTAYMGVIGPDAEHNLAVIKKVMQEQVKTYPDLTLIYLGPAQYEQDVRALLKPLNATIRYVVYP
jgi:hypothetical protein